MITMIYISGLQLVIHLILLNNVLTGAPKLTEEERGKKAVRLKERASKKGNATILECLRVRDTRTLPVFMISGPSQASTFLSTILVEFLSYKEAWPLEHFWYKCPQEGLNPNCWYKNTREYKLLVRKSCFSSDETPHSLWRRCRDEEYKETIEEIIVKNDIQYTKDNYASADTAIYLIKEWISRIYLVS